MLPGVDFTEMLLVAVIAVVVFGPRELPLMMRKLGRFTGKMRAMAFEFRQGFEELGRQAELEELRKEVADLKKHTGLEDLREDLEADKRALEADVQSAMAEPPRPRIEPPESETGNSAGDEPQGAPRARNNNFPKPHRRSNAAAVMAAAGAAGVADAEPAPAPYAGLSPEHPGYDTGDEAPATDEAAPAPASDPAADPHDGVHVVPDDEVRPAHPAARIAGAKQGSPA